MLRTATEGKCSGSLAIGLPIGGVRKVVLPSVIAKFEHVRGHGVLDAAATPTSANLDLATCKARVAVNVLAVVDMSGAIHGVPLCRKSDGRELLPFLRSTCILVIIPEHTIASTCS